MKELWEILVPRVFNDGAEVSVPHHQAWDAKVQQIAGGLTILKKARGIWRSPQGDIFQEEMIPVRVACTEIQMSEIVDFTITHYDPARCNGLSGQRTCHHQTPGGYAWHAKSTLI